ncbi:MAG: FAD-binding oxidoreductase, partial [Bacteroidales bacterium]|nr:FAD-binding oxidoreductase [Bacteroidales bacterium]
MVIHTDRLHRIAYATDASVYREMPYGVAYPENEGDIRELIRYAREKGISLIPRAGGTSIAGQVVGEGLVVDISRHFTKILEVNAEERWAWVQPGVVRDELNLALQPYGLFFSPETSTSNRCCIGGMVGNNSCGTHSLVYGSTRHHLLQLKGYLSDGSFFDTALRGDGELENRIYAQLEAWRDDSSKRKLIEDCFPDKTLRRRSCGYSIDEAIEDDIDLCKLICGSEGTLCFITAIKVSLDPLPPKEQMVLCAHCHSLEESFKANLIALKHNPVAIELMDGKILELGKGNAAAEKNRFFVEGDPAALLIAEFNGPESEAAADALERDLAESGLASVCTRVFGEDVAKVWALRKAGLGVLSGMKGDAKPVGVIEDTAVAPERLPAYMADFRAMMSRIGLDCVYYGHIGTGELHLRPILNLKTAEGRAKFREVAVETALLVRRHRGSLSGEHGDGRLRGEFIPLLYGEECYRMMCEVKRCWDAGGLFNPGKITGTPPMDEWLRYTVGQRYVMENGKKDKTWFNWRAAFDECKVEGASGVRSQTHALMCSIEQCNGAGDCRRSVRMGGTLCPAFKVSGEELMATRARANVLRECLTYGDGVVSPEVKEVLESCLACKACRSECPSNVDMTRIRAELLQQL